MHKSPEWMQDGACASGRYDPDLWTGGDGTATRQAKEICKTCEVREQCLEYAVTFPVLLRGTWGGRSYRDVRALRLERGIPVETESEAFNLPSRKAEE